MSFENQIYVQFVTVSASGKAYEGGIRPGDMVQRINNVPIYSIADFDKQIDAGIAAGEIKVKYLRLQGGDAVSNTATIAVSSSGGGI